MIITITDSYCCCCSAFLLPNRTVQVLLTSLVLYPLHQLHKDCGLRQLSPYRRLVYMSLHPLPFSLPLHRSNLFLLHIAVCNTTLFSGLSHSLVLTISARPHILQPSLAPHPTTSSCGCHTHCLNLYLLAPSPCLLFA